MLVESGVVEENNQFIASLLKENPNDSVGTEREKTKIDRRLTAF